MLFKKLSESQAQDTWKNTVNSTRSTCFNLAMKINLESNKKRDAARTGKQRCGFLTRNNESEPELIQPLLSRSERKKKLATNKW